MSHLAERIIAKSIPEPNTGCWLWECGAFRKKWGGPRGAIAVDGKQWLAHRASYFAFKGDLPKSAFVLHRCDTPLCVNPDHLFLGTHKDNMADMVRKERQWRPKGALNSQAKLTDDDVQKIRSLLGAMPHIVIAKTFGVHPSNISHIARRVHWKGGV